MRENNGPKYDYPPTSRCETRFLVCSIPRTGSTMLCRGLWHTGAAGAPKEYFNPVHMRDYYARWQPSDTRAYIQQLLRYRTSPNGVFGFKAHWTHLKQLMQEVDLDSEFPDLHYVYISREDKLRQAVSWVRAKQTGQWSSDTQSRAEPFYDPAAIREHLTLVARMEASWTRYFRETGIEPLRLSYEDLTRDYPRSLARVFEFLGMPRPARSLPAPPIQRQSDELTESFIRRYRRESAPAESDHSRFART